METSIYLAKLIGPIYLVVAIGLLLNPANFRAVAAEFTSSPALFFLSGILALIVGGLIVLLHNVWQGWPIVITVLGWVAILQGLVRTIFPAQATEIVGKMASSPHAARAVALIALALGGFLTAMGFGSAP